MKRRTINILGALALAVAILPTVGCGDGHDHDAAGGPESWTCAMHPQIQKAKPGKCPICAMALVPAGSLRMKGTPASGPRELVMTEEARALAKIATVAAERRFTAAEVRLVGKVDLDETLAKTVSAWFPARIDRLYIDFTGIGVKKGDHLAHVYSPEVLQAQRELLIAAKGRGPSEAVRDKLRLWGFSDAKIAGIEAGGKTSDRMDINTPTGGIVIEKFIREGDYVETGTPLFKIADLTRVWIQLDAYETDLPWLRYGQSVQFEAEAVPGKVFEGLVAFIAPTLDPKTRTVKVRVNAENPNAYLKPGMFVRAKITSKLAGAGKVIAPEMKGKWISPMHPEIIQDEPGNCPICGMDLVKVEELGYAILEESNGEPLVIPSSAVLRTGERAIVYVEVPDRENPTYEGREVVLGARAGDDYIVEAGLEEGERVVINGNFKIDSALQIIAKPSMMNRGSDAGVRWDLPHESVMGVLTSYLAIQKALAADDLGAAAAAAGKANFAGSEDLAGHVTAIAGTKDIEKARAHLLPVSEAVIALAKEHAGHLKATLYEIHCPMAFDFKGGSWLQESENVANPYFGAEMLECGAVKGKIEN